MADEFEIGGRRIGRGLPTFVIAELSANHNRDLDRALRLIEAAKEAGADAVKVQTFTAETITLASDRECFVVRGGTEWDGRTLHELYLEAGMPWEWHAPLKRRADELGLAFFSTPFDDSAVDYLEALDVPAYKIASFEVVDHFLLHRVALTGKPIIMSTGMATLGEIDEAVGVLREAGAKGVALLKCTSAYPAPPDDANLRTIPHLAEAFGVPVGLSDHTLDVAVPVVAVALGACILEKHLTLSRSDPGPDSSFSLEPHEFKATVAAVRIAERALGSVHYGATEREQANRAFRRSLFAVQDIKAGEPFSLVNVRSIRPGHGLPPRELSNILGRQATRDVPRGTPLSWDDFTTS